MLIFPPTPPLIFHLQAVLLRGLVGGTFQQHCEGSGWGGWAAFLSEVKVQVLGSFYNFLFKLVVWFVMWVCSISSHFH